VLALFLLPWVAVAPPAQEADERAQWKTLAERCGEELAWAPDWEAAAARARAEEKPILAVAWLYPGFDLADSSRRVFAMDTDVIELVNARCVPLHLTLATRAAIAEHTSYGLSPTAFGSGLLVLAPDGEPLADCSYVDPTAAYDFLCSALAAQPELAGGAVPPGLPALERAERHLARGELDAAAALLAEPTSARAFLARARLLRRRHDALGARTALEAARAHEPGELVPAIVFEGVTNELSLANVFGAHALCRELLEQHAGSEEALGAAYVLGLLEVANGQRPAGEARWRALARDHADSRWALQAAATLLAPGVELACYRLAAPPEDVRATLADVPYAPAPAGKAKGAPAAEALGWLRARRRADGGWPDPSELAAGARDSNALSVAIDALGARALLARGEAEPGAVRREAELALALGRASLSERPRGPTYMTYEVWSDALLLELLSDLLASEAPDLPAEELRGLGRELVEALAARQRANGGWSYFEAVSLAEGAAKPEQSISFVTASVVLALQHAQAAGIAVDGAGLARALDALEAFRSEAGVFAYMLWSYQERAPDEQQVAGAAGRAPLCELALLRAGRSDTARLEAALGQFFEHAAVLAQETGKALMHCGAEGQGCHYVLYDYAMCARAIAALPAAEQKPWRARLLTRLDSARRSDGAYCDTPILGPASGTALALLAFAELERD